MTVSALARELRTNKGNVAHHVAALERVGLVRRAGTTVGRGGTGVLFERSSPTLRFDGPDATGGMIRLVEQGLIEDREAFAFLRQVRLTRSQAHDVADHLEKLLGNLPDVENGTATAVFVSVFRP